MHTPSSDTAEFATRERYSKAAAQVEAELCCPVEYDRSLLEAVPPEVIEKDYGCGDPSKHLRAGETVLDLGSGAGKICFIASQVVGPEGRVIGVDMTDAMLDVARRNAPLVAERIGYSNVEFRKGRIQDLKLDLALLEEELGREPITDGESYLRLGERIRRLSAERPLVRDESVDAVVSNCVLNLVEQEEKGRLFDEIHRVLRVGGRAVISDIVSDEPVSDAMRRNPELWSGCISGAYTEEGFLKAFLEAGFEGVRVLEWGAEPWRAVEGLEFRSLTVEAYKVSTAPSLELNQAVIYKGPFSEVVDDGGERYLRGRRHAVCSQNFQRLKEGPYADSFVFIEPRVPVPIEKAEKFNCCRAERRDPRETKGAAYSATTEAADDCCG